MARKKVTEEVVEKNIDTAEEIKEEKNAAEAQEPTEPETVEGSPDDTAGEEVKKDVTHEEIAEQDPEDVPMPDSGKAEPKPLNLGVLKIDVKADEEQEDDENAVVWHELAVMNRSRKIVPAVITGLERTGNLGEVVVAYYKTQRILIPLSEMNIDLSNDKEYLEEGTISERITRICNTMLGAEIDLIIRGMDKNSGSVVASRREAMLKKRERFYVRPLSDGLPQVRVGRVVEARIIGVTPQVARFDVFGVEVSLPASRLSWDWVADVSEKFFVGDKMKLLITDIEGESVDNLRIRVDAKSQIANTSLENLAKCSVQGRYIGEITNVKNGIAYLRLKIGVNAIAHTNNDKRTPGKGDIVSFVITRISPEYGNVSGIITRIIKQVI